MLIDKAIVKKNVKDSKGEKIKSSGLNNGFIIEIKPNPIATKTENVATINFKYNALLILEISDLDLL